MNPGEFREVGHRVVDLLAKYLEHIEEKPVFPHVEPSTLQQLFDEPLPLTIPALWRKCCKNSKKRFFRIARMSGTRVTWG
jgi:hypothetical protein